VSRQRIGGFLFLRRIVLIAALTLAAAPSLASAAPPKKLEANLGALWTAVFETPNAQNPFGGGGPESGCFNLGRVVAPFGPTGVAACTVKTGTKIFVAARSFECSTFEGNGTIDAQLRACAKAKDLPSAPAVTVDGAPVAISEVETGLLRITLPADNLFGLPAGSTGLSVAHGWVALLHPLPPGPHTITITSPSSTITTTITVNPGH
jgi:hypothetical protein